MCGLSAQCGARIPHLFLKFQLLRVRGVYAVIGINPAGHKEHIVQHNPTAEEGRS